MITHRLFVLFIFLNAVLYSQGSIANSYSFAIVPQQSAQQLAKTWQPLFDEIERQTGIEIRFTTTASIPEFEKRLMQNEYDFAYMNPYHYTVFSKNNEYQALAKAKHRSIQGIIIVHKDSNFKTLTDLQGAKMAFPAPLAFAATLINQASLQQLKLDIDSVYVRTHDSVYLNIAQKLVDAGGGIKRTFNNMPEDIKNQLHILWESPGYTPHALAYHKRVDKDDVSKILSVLIHLNDTEAGRSFLKAMGIEGLEQAFDSDWDDVRALDIRINDAQ